MPGAGSSLDKNDWQMLKQLNQNVGRLADQIERLNENLEGDSSTDFECPECGATTSMVVSYIHDRVESCDHCGYKREDDE